MTDDFGFHEPMDQGLQDAMDIAFQILTAHPDNHDTPEQLKLRIIGHNLRALSTVLLMADDNPEVVGINVKQLVLGLLGTSDWALRDLPEIDYPEHNLEGGIASE